MKIKMIMHLMPWEIDHAILTFIKLKKSFEYLPEDIQILFDCVLNLSDAVIDWSESEIGKKYFIEKFNSIKSLIECFTVTRYEIIDTQRLYGHLDLQRESVSDDVDGYIYLCSDFNFDEYTLSYICDAAKHINDKYFILTPEIYKGWDKSWDIISSNKYKNIQHENCHDECAFKIEVNNLKNDVYVDKINQIKFAGWFDFFSKDFINEFATFPNSWSGYGPWDFYAMILSYKFNSLSNNKKINQYIVRGKIIKGINSKLIPHAFTGYYRDMIKLQPINQRKDIESKLNDAINERISKFNLEFEL